LGLLISSLSIATSAAILREPFGIAVVTDIVVNASCFALVFDAGQLPEWPARYPVLWKFLISGGALFFAAMIAI
jgi:hypothetical protein